jgi:hypothetical protein
MRSLNRRATATVVAIALLLWGSNGLEAHGAAQWFAYGALGVAMLLGYYALTGRGLWPGGDAED